VIQKPIFAPSFQAEIVESEAVFLLSERGHFVLKGELYCRLAPLLDGTRTTDSIVDALAEKMAAAEVYYALALLENKGYIVDADHAATHDGRATFWHEFGVDARLAEQRLEACKVSVAQFGDVSIEPVVSALGAMGVRTGEDGDFAIAVTDDYLRNGLADFNAAALKTERPWLLVKPVGTVIWLGPVFRPGETGCWECLSQRLRANREVEAYLGRRQHIPAQFSLSRAAIPSTLQAALQLAVTETLLGIAADEQHARQGILTTLDLLTSEMQKHHLVRRPQCTCCGDPSAYRADREPIPVTLQPRLKQFTLDGGHRTAAPEQTLARYAHHISAITGTVPLLSPFAADDESGMHVYITGHNRAMHSESLYTLRDGLRRKSGGKGMTDAQAKASGLCEALERCSGVFTGDEIRTTHSYRSLGSRAIHPNACMLFSARQYEERQERNAHGLTPSRIPEPFDEEAELEWTPVWSLTTREFKYLPTGYLYYDYPSGGEARFFWADSNGNAAGNTLEEAILQGFMELVERDSVALWWYNRVRRPGVDLDSFADPFIQDMRVRYQKLNRDISVLDITSDLQIPSFVALSRVKRQADENILIGTGAHFDARIGIFRALTEWDQMAAAASRTRVAIDDPMFYRWWNSATFANQPHLDPGSMKPHVFSDYSRDWSDDLRKDVLRCQSIVEHQGLDMLVLDQTRPDIGLPVVKVIVPGLRHFWPRFGPGRLYTVPVNLGWLAEPLPEHLLNPMVFP